MNKVFNYNGHNWRLIAVGRTNEAGAIYLHLASTTEGKMQRNGFCPKQICGYFHYDAEQLADAKNLRDAE